MDEAGPSGHLSPDDLRMNRKRAYEGSSVDCCHATRMQLREMSNRCLQLQNELANKHDQLVRANEQLRACNTQQFNSGLVRTDPYASNVTLLVANQTLKAQADQWQRRCTILETDLKLRQEQVDAMESKEKYSILENELAKMYSEKNSEIKLLKESYLKSEQKRIAAELKLEQLKEDSSSEPSHTSKVNSLLQRNQLLKCDADKWEHKCKELLDQLKQTNNELKLKDEQLTESKVLLENVECTRVETELRLQNIQDYDCRVADLQAQLEEQQTNFRSEIAQLTQDFLTKMAKLDQDSESKIARLKDAVKERECRAAQLKDMSKKKYLGLVSRYENLRKTYEHTRDKVHRLEKAMERSGTPQDEKSTLPVFPPEQVTPEKEEQRLNQTDDVCKKVNQLVKYELDGFRQELAHLKTMVIPKHVIYNDFDTLAAHITQLISEKFIGLLHIAKQVRNQAEAIRDENVTLGKELQVTKLELVCCKSKCNGLQEEMKNKEKELAGLRAGSVKNVAVEDIMKQKNDCEQKAVLLSQQLKISQKSMSTLHNMIKEIANSVRLCLSQLRDDLFIVEAGVISRDQIKKEIVDIGDKINLVIKRMVEKKEHDMKLCKIENTQLRGMVAELRSADNTMNKKIKQLSSEKEVLKKLSDARAAMLQMEIDGLKLCLEKAVVAKHVMEIMEKKGSFKEKIQALERSMHQGS